MKDLGPIQRTWYDKGFKSGYNSGRLSANGALRTLTTKLRNWRSLTFVVIVAALIIGFVMYTPKAEATVYTPTQEQCDYLLKKADRYYKYRWYRASSHFYRKAIKCEDAIEPELCPIECDRTAELVLSQKPSSVTITTTAPYSYATLEYIDGGTRVYSVAWQPTVFIDSFGVFENTTIKGVRLSFDCDDGQETYFDLDR